MLCLIVCCGFTLIALSFALFIAGILRLLRRGADRPRGDVQEVVVEGRAVDGSEGREIPGDLGVGELRLQLPLQLLSVEPLLLGLDAPVDLSSAEVRAYHDGA